MLGMTPIFRRSSFSVFLLVLLLPTVTGWSGDNCCPIPEKAAGRGCVAAGACSLSTFAGDPSAEGDDGASHRSIICSCVTCEILFAHASLPALEGPDHSGRVVSDSTSGPRIAFLPEIFRPPLA